MKIVICGLAITSSWGNGHATTYRSLARALNARGHDIVFFERDLEWYRSNRDMPEPPFCRVHMYERWPDASPRLCKELADADVAVVGSYFPDGVDAVARVLDSGVPTKAFYDIDTPITISKLRSGDAEYLRQDQVAGFDLYFSFTGGPMLGEIETRFGARRAVPLYCSFDPDRHRFSRAEPRFQCDLSYMGTYAPDRQGKLAEMLCRPASRLPQQRFIVAGPQYPKTIEWPKNVTHIIHLEPKFHAPFYGSSRMTLNLTRKEMVEAGYSPSVRLFEAAGSGAAIISDWWTGLDTFFRPQEEILPADSAEQVIQYLGEVSWQEARSIGGRARERVLAEHSAQKRAAQFEEYVAAKGPFRHRATPVQSAATS
ncbi:MAG: glycosyltransferase [Acidobacteria bacterium]|nr:glycosyltransferase [Acidobacteriota bacterium]MBV9622374.1 glycosyltransferase [Acidobacteriota bacterium]